MLDQSEKKNFQPLSCKTKSNRDWPPRLFPRLPMITFFPALATSRCFPALASDYFFFPALASGYIFFPRQPAVRFSVLTTGHAIGLHPILYSVGSCLVENHSKTALLQRTSYKSNNKYGNISTHPMCHLQLTVTISAMLESKPSKTKQIQPVKLDFGCFFSVRWILFHVTVSYKWSTYYQHI